VLDLTLAKGELKTIRKTTTHPGWRGTAKLPCGEDGISTILVITLLVYIMEGPLIREAVKHSSSELQ